MTVSWSVLAAGELITDHLFAPHPGGGTVYVGVRGGGSAFNVAANLAALNSDERGHIFAWGPGGNDAAGRLSQADLVAAGAHTEGIRLLPRRRTRLIFERIGQARTGAVGGTAHSFSGTCTVCGQRDSGRSRPTLDGVAASLMPVPPVDVLVLDRLSPARMRLVRGLRAQEAATLLDLGAVDYLRYTPVVEIVSSLANFDAVILSESVAHSILARAGLTTPEALAEVAGIRLLAVTQGPKGLRLITHTLDAPSGSALSAVQGPVTDDAGAGDALVANIVHGALTRAIDSGRSPRSAFSNLNPADAERICEAALHRIPRVLAAPGARGHLAYPAPPSDYDQFIGVQVDGLLEHARAVGACPVCRLPLGLAEEAHGRVVASEATTDHQEARPESPRTAKRRTGASRNVGLLLRRVLQTAEQEEAERLAADVLTWPGAGYVIGSGGSYVAATYLAEMTRHEAAGPFLAAVRPADFLRTSRAVDIVIAISYSGGTSDLGHVLDHAAALGVPRLVLLTAARRPPLASRLRPLSHDLLVRYGPLGEGARAGVRERGFVSIAATVMPVVPFVKAKHGLPALVDLRSQLEGRETDVSVGYELATSGGHGELLLIGGGWASPALVDVESKFAEADLGTVRLDEPKDFSHGRFISVLGAGPRGRPKQPVLMLFAGEPSAYERSLYETLVEDGHLTFRMQARRGDAVGGLELLCRVQQLAQAYGEAKGIDISRPVPPPPPAGLALYRRRGRPA